VLDSQQGTGTLARWCAIFVTTLEHLQARNRKSYLHLSSVEYTSIVGGSIHTSGCFTSHTGVRCIRFKIYSRFEIICPIPTLFQVSNTIAIGERLYCGAAKSGLQCYHHVQWVAGFEGVNVASFSKSEVGGDFNTCSGGVSPSSLSSDSYAYTEGIKIRSAQNINFNNY